MSKNREPYFKVKAYLIEQNISRKDIAKILHISPQTLNKRLNGFGGDFRLSEVTTLYEVFGIPYALFFEPIVPIKEPVEIK
ncbi:MULTISPECIES: helix-turn-helix domain-containing protein [Oceanobacillus]|uniref:helix-turn-helix domain-containing protein n=1 Tax=Oceanobacillus TaxID=182709 RepID=UPI00059599AC|nr:MULTISPECIES: helix-turn-helix transcriptional regulator [Oceanobacillus]